MGLNLTIIKNSSGLLDKNHKLLFLSLSKIREYYGLFKSVCENFSIDNNEY